MDAVVKSEAEHPRRILEPAPLPQSGLNGYARSGLPPRNQQVTAKLGRLPWWMRRQCIREEYLVAREPENSNDGPLDRAVAILTFVAEQKKALSAAEIAVAHKLPLPTAHRLIGNLEDRGLIQKALGTKRYLVGSKLVTLAAKTIGAAFRTVRRHAVLSA